MRESCDVEDVDKVTGGGIKEVVVKREKVDVEGVRFEGGERSMSDGEVKGFGGEFLERRDRRQGLEREVGLEAATAGCLRDCW